MCYFQLVLADRPQPPSGPEQVGLQGLQTDPDQWHRPDLRRHHIQGRLMHTTRMIAPRPPLQPSEEDCCGQGCQRCVHDIYEEEMRRYRRAVAEYEAGYTDSEKNTTLNTEDYVPFTLVNIEKITEDTSVYVFRTEPPSRLPRYSMFDI